MKEGLERFVFDEHILRIDDLTPRIERMQRFLSSPLNFPIRLLLRGRLGKLKFHQEYSYEKYDRLKDFFSSLISNPRNKISYDPSQWKIRINGSGSEIFKCDAPPIFYRSDKGEETLLPVRIGKDSSLLRIHKHPQIQITPFDDFFVEYSFDTSISLGGYYDTFTNKQTKTYKDLLYFLCSSSDDIGIFCGKPGNIYYRAGDALYQGLWQSIFGNFCQEGNVPNDGISGRPNLRLYGTVSLKDSGLLYQGDFDCYNTSFPFFVRGGHDEDKERKPTPRAGVSLE